MKVKIYGEHLISSSLYGPVTVFSVYEYDAKEHIDSCDLRIITATVPKDEGNDITKSMADTNMNWFLPTEYEGSKLILTQHFEVLIL